MIDERKTFRLEQHGLNAEEFREGVVCRGTVFPWKREFLSVYTGSRCWGHTVTVPAGSYACAGGFPPRVPGYHETPCEYVLDDPDMYLSVIRVVQTDPLQLECVEYITVEEGDDTPGFPSLEETLSWHEEGDGVWVDGCPEGQKTILIPPTLNGRPVVRLALDRTALGGMCRTLIISKEIKEVVLDFENAPNLKRLDFPPTGRLLSSPNGISRTVWFSRHSGQPVYLGDYYCGTPGGGIYGGGELRIADGTTAIADGADFHCYWRRIVMPDGVETIGRCAFSDARCLEELQLPPSIREIGDSAFQYCPQLKGLTPPPNREHPPRRWGEAAASGTCRAYPASGPICAGGNRYPDISALTAQRETHGLYRDGHGNPVQKITVENPDRNGDRSGVEEVTCWYVLSPDGLSEITFDPVCRVWFVREGISPEGLPPAVLARLDDSMLR